MTTNLNLNKAKRDNTDEQSIASQASTRSKSTQSSEKSNAPSYARGTISTLSRSNTITKEDRNRQGKQVEKKEQKLTEFKYSPSDLLQANVLNTMKKRLKKN
ncbi:hypothetical protein G6F68_018730 [Rhizopus microsporus]|nr:hypothetical protein G6F68_018730 [Rhizopus microsporus]